VEYSRVFPARFFKPLNNTARKGLLLRCWVVVCFCAVIRVFGGTQTVWLGWDVAPPEENISEYHVYYGTHSGIYTNSVVSHFWDGAFVDGLEVNVTYYFAVSATDTDGNNSLLSAELAYVIPVLKPVKLEALVDYTDNVATGIEVVGSWDRTTDWELQYSTDLSSWTSWWTGRGTSCDVYAGFDWGDQYFFRLINY
jgi:hypothetical protein